MYKELLKQMRLLILLIFHSLNEKIFKTNGKDLYMILL